MRKNIFSEIHATSMYILNINSIRDLLEDPVSSHHVSNFFFFFYESQSSLNRRIFNFWIGSGRISTW